MNTKEYIIPFSGLALGEHVFEMNISDEFFENIDYSEIKKGQIKVMLNLLKRSNMMVLNFELSGTVKTLCDKCAGEFDLPIAGNYRLIVKVGGQADIGEEDDDIIGIAATESKIDLTEYLYQYITLSVPIKREHEKPEDCDKDVLLKLSQLAIDEPEAPRETDPRWEELKRIKLN